MKYAVAVHADALVDIENAHGDLSDFDPAYAERWMEELHAAIRALDEFPNRHPYAPESTHCSFQVRQILVGKYRVLNIAYYLRCLANPSACSASAMPPGVPSNQAN